MRLTCCGEKAKNRPLFEWEKGPDKITLNLEINEFADKTAFSQSIAPTSQISPIIQPSRLSTVPPARDTGRNKPRLAYA